MYEIDGPYLFKQGKHAGEYLEEVVFKNPGYIIACNRYRDGRNVNRFQKHLEALLENAPTTTKKCPICGEKSVKYFLFLNHEDVNEKLCCCENPECQNDLKMNHPGDYLLPIKLKSILVGRTKGQINAILRLIKKVTGIKKVNAEDIFSIFIGEPLKKA